jgi:heme exporter protein C
MTLSIYANPRTFLNLSAKIMPWLSVVLAVVLPIALYLALFASPVDYQQGNAVRMMYVHVPAAQLAMGVYLFMAINSAVFLIWKHTLASLLAHAAAPLGAGFTLICIFTGMLWGKPMWGAWWVWDARLTSVLVLWFLYLGYMAICDVMDYSERRAKAAAILNLIGVANIPVIKFSVEWWNTLHQPASLIRGGGPSIHDPLMLTALLLMGLAFMLIFTIMLLKRTRAALLEMRIRRLRMT